MKMILIGQWSEQYKWEILVTNLYFISLQDDLIDYGSLSY